jgi:protein-S-isoprenylcysteine O-methyltransferase Ste14
VFAWTGAGLFVASLTYFLYSYFVTFAETSSGTVTAAPLIGNIFLFSAFALHHSVFARESVRAWVVRHVPATLERSCYVWVASLMLIAVCAMWQPLPGVAWDVRGAARWILRAVQLFGLWLTVRSAAIIDIWDLAGVRPARSIPNSQLPTPKGNEFKTEGPYGWVRHPIYLGWVLVVFAVPLMTITQLLFAIVSCVYLLVAVPLEERSLLKTSGGGYERYRQQVRWKLLPGLY